MNIIAVNIKQGGGLVLLYEILDYAVKHKLNIRLFADGNTKFDKYVNYNEIEIIKFTNTISKILLFGKKIDNVLYFGNIPPFTRKGRKSFLYFHNLFYLQPSNSLLRKFQFKFLILKFYIRLFHKNVDEVFTQSKYVDCKFENVFKRQTILNVMYI